MSEFCFLRKNIDFHIDFCGDIDIDYKKIRPRISPKNETARRL